jgi:phosphoribosylpyrophosphate synthetase
LTVARTVARTHHERGTLGGSFFFSKSGGNLSNAKKLATTLAKQLANQIPASRRYISDAVMERKDIVDHSLRDQWDHLILQPLSKLKSTSILSTVVFVIDALDECESEKDIRAVIKVMVYARSLRNIRLRVFITSRPEIPIRDGFGKIAETDRQTFVLHKIEPKLVDRDLRLFFMKNFSTIRDERGFTPDDWPGMQVIKRLVEISCGLFIWASTACRFIREGRRFAKRRIAELLHGHRSGVGPEQQLDQIYVTVLQNSVQQGYRESEKAEIYATLREVLGSLVVLFLDISVESLANLIDIPVSDIEDTLADLHTIFRIEKQTSSPIRLHHPTLGDFLLNKDRCSDPNFWVDEKHMHGILAKSCIKLMSKMLKNDICGLKHPATQTTNVDPAVVEQRIPPELQYACLYWVRHYRHSGIILRDDDDVHRSLQKHCLAWIETISLIGRTAEMDSTIRLYQAILVVSASRFLEM